MDIVVKSFFRPYYLERCLTSINTYVKGNYQITILDDGTPEIYLVKIRQSFPGVRILKSEEYENKIDLIEQHLAGKKAYSNSIMPVELWKSCINECSDYLLLLEEDNWITEEISIEAIEKAMIENDLLIVKMGWNNNSLMIGDNVKKISDDVEELITEIPIQSLGLMKFYLRDRFKIKSILNKLNLVTVKSLLPYYRLYTVSAAFFNRTYWQYLWSDAKPKIDEPSQLLKSLTWKNEGNGGRYGKAVSEIIRTSFLTASTNRLKSVDFDMIRLNHILNQAWLSNELDANQNFPNDFSVEYLGELIEIKNDPLCTVTQWIAWVTLFKSLHRTAGSEIDY